MGMVFIGKVSAAILCVPVTFWAIPTFLFGGNPALVAGGLGLFFLAFSIIFCSRFFYQNYQNKDAPRLLDFVQKIRARPQRAFWGGVCFALAGVFIGDSVVISSFGELSGAEIESIIDYRFAILGGFVFSPVTLYAGSYIAAFAASEGLGLLFSAVLLRLIVATITAGALPLVLLLLN